MYLMNDRLLINKNNRLHCTSNIHIQIHIPKKRAFSANTFISHQDLSSKREIWITHLKYYLVIYLIGSLSISDQTCSCSTVFSPPTAHLEAQPGTATAEIQPILFFSWSVNWFPMHALLTSAALDLLCVQIHGKLTRDHLAEDKGLSPEWRLE